MRWGWPLLLLLAGCDVVNHGPRFKSIDYACVKDSQLLQIHHAVKVGNKGTVEHLMHNGCFATSANAKVKIIGTRNGMAYVELLDLGFMANMPEIKKMGPIRVWTREVNIKQ